MKKRNMSTRRLAAFMPAASSDHSSVCVCAGVCMRAQHSSQIDTTKDIETKHCRLLSVWAAAVSSNCFYEQAIMMLARTECCIRDDVGMSKMATCTTRWKHPKHDTKFLNEKDKASAETQRRKHPSSACRRKWDRWKRVIGKKYGGMIYLYSIRWGRGGVYKRTGTLLDHLASRTWTQLFKTECRMEWFMRPGQKKSLITQNLPGLRCPEWRIIGVL